MIIVGDSQTSPLPIFPEGGGRLYTGYTCHFVNIYIPTVHRLYDQHLNKTLSLVYICSQVTDATIALAKKEKPIKTLFLRLTDRGVLGGIA